jgi:hypothetical protein
LRKTAGWFGDFGTPRRDGSAGQFSAMNERQEKSSKNGRALHARRDVDHHRKDAARLSDRNRPCRSLRGCLVRAHRHEQRGRHQRDRNAFPQAHR